MHVCYDWSRPNNGGNQQLLLRKFNATKETMAYFKHMATLFHTNKYASEDSVDALAKFALDKLACTFVGAERQALSGGVKLK